MKLSIRREALELRHTFTISRGSQDVVDVVIAEVEQDGKVGRGEASPSSFYDEDDDTVAKALEGIREYVEAGDVYRYREFLDGAAERLGKNRGALCALDLAVFDCFTRNTGVPLHRLLGLDPANAPLSSFTIGISTLNHMIEKTREAANYPILKIKVGTPDDIEIIRRMREVTSATFRVDANCGWTAQETIDKSPELAALGVEFIEQPLPPDQLDEMEEVFAKSSLPVVADENSIVPEDVPKLVGRFQGINIKLVKCGGIQPALRMVELARVYGMKIMFGCMIESSVCIGAAAELGAFADYLDLDGNVLITNDPFAGMTNVDGRLGLPESGWVEPRH